MILKFYLLFIGKVELNERIYSKSTLTKSTLNNITRKKLQNAIDLYIHYNKHLESYNIFTNAIRQNMV